MPAPPGSAGCARSATRRRGRRVARPLSGRRRSRRARAWRRSRRRASASAAITFAEPPLVEIASTASPARACAMIWRAKTASYPTSFAIALRIAVSSVRSSAGRAGRPLPSRRFAQVGDEVHRIGRRAAVPQRQHASPGGEAGAQRARHRGDLLRPLAERGGAQRGHLGGLGERGRAHVGEHGAEVVLLLRRGTGTGSRRRRCRARRARSCRSAARDGRRTRARAPTARGRASPPAPARRTGPRPAGSAPPPLRPARTRPSGSRRRGRRRRRARSRRRSRTRARCRRAPPAARPSPARCPSAGSARLPTITGCTNSTATWRTSERSAAEAPNAISRPPRANRSAMRWQSSRDALALGGEEALVGVGAEIQQRPQPVDRGMRRGVHAGAPARSGRRASHSRSASTPSPVRALTSRCATPGWTESRW